MKHKGFWLRRGLVLIMGCFLPVVAWSSGPLESFDRVFAKAQGPVPQAQLLLFDYLDLYQNNASLFYDFGICTSVQKLALETTVPQAMALLKSVEAKGSETVPAQFTLAYGLYLMQLCDKDGRAGRLEKGADILTRLLASSGDPWQIHPRARCLLGRIRLAQGRPGQALEQFNKVIEIKALDLNHLTAHLGRVAALDQLDKTDLAQEALSKLVGHPLVKRNLLLRLLLTDVQHRRSQSYEPYFALLADKTIRRQAPALTRYIRQRWIQNVFPAPAPGSSPENSPGSVPETFSSVSETSGGASLPATVVAAIGEQLRIEGQNMALDHDPAAQGRLQWAYRVNNALLKRTDVASTPGIQTTAQFNKAMSLYYQDKNDAKRAMAAAVLLTQMARDNPSHVLALTGISYAMEMLRSQRQTDAYRQCAKVLFEKFPTSDAADNERLAYAATILIPQKQFAQATALLEEVPISHGTYFEAQRERLYCMTHDPSLAQQLRAEAVRLCDEAARLKTPQSANAAGHAKWILSEMAFAKKQWAKSLQWLDGFEQVYASNDPLRLMKHQQQVSILMQLDQTQAPLAISLAQNLLNTAAQWNMSEEDLLPIKLVQARSLRAMGQFVEAKVVLEPLAEQFDRDAMVIHEWAETCFELGTEADLLKAGRGYQKLIEGLSAENPHYWNAWMRYLQICDQTGRHTEIIADRVRTLGASDPALGGEPYQSELIRLSEKYGPDERAIPR